MTHRALLSALAAFIFLATNTQAQTEPATTEADRNATSLAPVVESWEPKTGSVHSIIKLSGFRLYPFQYGKVKAFVIQNGVDIPARTGGGQSVTNNENNGPQKLEVILPEEIVPGEAQIVIEFDGRRSVPATITITEWKPPVIKRVNPMRGAPGTVVGIECDGFHVNDEVEVTDAEGRRVNVGGGGSSVGTAFGVPKDSPEGVLTIRIGNSKYGNGQYTEPVTFTVTNDPFPLELWTAEMKSVAPGQWLDLQSFNHDQLKHSERTEVAFKQAGRTIVVTTPKPFRPHVGVPSALSPGEVQLQVRIWCAGKSSQWSEPVVFQLASKAVVPLIGGIRVGEGSWVSLWPGPDRPDSVSVKAGAEIVMNGVWPVADARKLKVVLLRGGDGIELGVAEVDEKADWFSDVRVRLPATLAVGDWQMIVVAEEDRTQVELPIVIRVKR
jgi:hypothetical protein